MSHPRLPLELIELIISHLRPDREQWTDVQELRTLRLALYNCALTCHALLPVSRYTLTHTISIASRGTLSRLVAAPQTLSRVRELYVCSSSVFHTLPLQLAGKLPHIVFLELHDLDWATTPPPPLLFAALTALRTVSTLVLSNCHFASFHQLTRLLCAFRALSDLPIRDITWDTPGGGPSPLAEPRRPAIAELDSWLNEDNTAVLCEWLLRTPSRRSLRECRMYFDRRSERQKHAVDALLRAAGPTLHVLGFTFMMDDADVDEDEETRDDSASTGDAARSANDDTTPPPLRPDWHMPSLAPSTSLAVLALSTYQWTPASLSPYTHVLLSLQRAPRILRLALRHTECAPLPALYAPSYGAHTCAVDVPLLLGPVRAWAPLRAVLAGPRFARTSVEVELWLAVGPEGRCDDAVVAREVGVRLAGAGRELTVEPWHRM